MNTREDLFLNIKHIITQFMDADFKEAFEILEYKKTEATFQSDLGIDSIDIVEIVTEIEDMFNVQFENSEIEGITKIGDSIDVLMTRLEAKPI